MSHYAQVVQFNEAARGDLPRKPATLSLDHVKLSLRLLIEESFESVEACFHADSAVLKRMRDHLNAIQFTLAHETKEVDLQQNNVELLDGLCDTIVVAMGMAAMAGLPLNEGMSEVNRSNLAKIDPETGRCIKDEGGKIMKPSGWTKPDLASVISAGYKHGNRVSFVDGHPEHCEPN